MSDQVKTKTMNELLKESNAYEVRILNALEETGGEITEEIGQLMAMVDRPIAHKTDAYAIIMDSLEARVERLKTDSRAFTDAAKTCERVIDHMKDRLKNLMAHYGKDNLEGERFRFKLSRVKPRLEVDQDLLPKEYLIAVTEYQVDKDKIRMALDLGEVIPGAKFVESNSLRRYINKT